MYFFSVFVFGYRYFAEHVRDDYAAGQLDAQVRLKSPLPPRSITISITLTFLLVTQVEGVLQEMRELSICGAS